MPKIEVENEDDFYHTEDFHPLLKDDVESHWPLFGGFTSQATSGTKRSNRLRRIFLAASCHGVISILILFTLVSFAPGLLVEMIRRYSFDPTVVPAKHLPPGFDIRYEMIPGDVNFWSNRLYMGEPSRDSEIAWNHLIAHGPFKVTDEEAPRLNLTVGLPLVHGGYGIRVGVDHNLHCLRHIRQMYYFDHYWANMTTPDEKEWLHEHTVHCLESLRTSVMCYPDLSLHPHYASGGKYHPMNIGAWDKKECVNWNTLQESVKSRRMPVSEWGPEMIEELRIARERVVNAANGIHT